VALGACIIEKHFTLSRADNGPDSEFSLEPEELEYLCRNAKGAWQALGKAGFERLQVEEDSKVFRRSLYIVKDMKQGDVLSVDNLKRIRPGNGLPPKYFHEILGRRVNRDLAVGTFMSFEYIE